MLENITSSIISIIGFTVNCTTMFLIFPSKRDLRFSITALILFLFVFIAAGRVLPVLTSDYTGLRGLVCLPIMIWLFRGQVFQKIFAFFLQYFLSLFLGFFVLTIPAIFIPAGSSIYSIVCLIMALIVYVGYITLVIIYGRNMFQKLFIDGHRGEWGLYTF